MHPVFLGLLIGLVGGVTSGLFGVGGGIVMVPAMYYLLKADIKTAVGTSLVVIIPTALVGSYKHFQLGNIDWRLAATLVPLAVVGGFVGAWLTGPMQPDLLRRLFGGLLVVGGLYTMFR
ncbi:MAG: hypothetical protein RJA22_1481 [Verrucomicrobiota bacterium]